jgi:hypothetical protein
VFNSVEVAVRPPRAVPASICVQTATAVVPLLRYRWPLVVSIQSAPTAYPAAGASEPGVPGPAATPTVCGVSKKIA